VTSTALLVLNPRDIPYCMDALRALDVPTCWASYMTEVDAASWLNHAVANTAYDRYVIVADDCEPTREALDAVLALHDEGHQVATGYSNFDKTDPRVNLCANWLHPEHWFS
jgi:hypothetical protein